MKYFAWFNLSSATFCALNAIHGNAFDFYVWMCALNIMSAGIMFVRGDSQ